VDRDPGTQERHELPVEHPALAEAKACVRVVKSNGRDVTVCQTGRDVTVSQTGRDVIESDRETGAGCDSE
jgi:hypothetical protein